MVSEAQTSIVTLGDTSEDKEELLPEIKRETDEDGFESEEFGTDTGL